MSGFKITATQKNPEATIQLPSSKSLSNRALILQRVISHLNHDHLVIKNISEADDTLIMIEALNITKGTVHIKNAGTCMRFLTAYYAATPGSQIILQCDERMKDRPVEGLVETLLQLGADIKYLENYGYAPLQITGKQLNGGQVFLNANQSSQFVSALMMVAPLFNAPLQIEVDKNAGSLDYISMTAMLMESLGFRVSVQNMPGLKICIENKLSRLNQKIYEVEADWSSAAFVYQAVALADSARITLPRLSLQSMQGDKRIAELMLDYGVKTIEYEGHILLEKIAQTISKEHSTIDLKNHPDLAPPLISALAALGSANTFTGLESLKVKESDRLMALQLELSKLGYVVIQPGNGILQTSESIESVDVEDVLTQTYNDHRLAMCFALLAFKRGNISLSETASVVKSFPGFWDEMKKLGITTHLNTT